MSEVRLVVREAERHWSGVIHGSWADRAIAALSADPVTREELEAALVRFAKPIPSGRFLSNLSFGLNDEPYDAGIVVLDLVARMVVVDSTYSSPCQTGEVCYDDGQCCTDKWLQYHLADDWLFSTDRHHWRAVADARRQERSEHPLLDARAVLYGRPLLEFIARETCSTFSQRETSGTLPQLSDTEILHELLGGIHAEWLLTTREDLRGVSPRDVAIARHNHITWDLQDRCQQWSRLGECPPGLDVSSHAFRYGGFGTHEWVQYYHLVRELLWSCWERIAELESDQNIDSRILNLTVEEFLAEEVPYLETVRDEWLGSPDPDCHNRTPRSIINRERSRLPEAVSARDAVVDPDCPCCQMMADLPGPVFWHLDCSEMDDGFAFDIYHRTREEWEAEQREWEDFNRRFDSEWKDRTRSNTTDSAVRVQDDDSVWKSSFSAGDTGDVPSSVSLFGIGCHVGELIDDIRSDDNPDSVVREDQELIRRLNRDFGNLREILQNSDPCLAEALVKPVIDRFLESLTAVSNSHSDLVPKCESLGNKLTGLIAFNATESIGDAGDLEYPF